MFFPVPCLPLPLHKEKNKMQIFVKTLTGGWKIDEYIILFADPLYELGPRSRTFAVQTDAEMF